LFLDSPTRHGTPMVTELLDLCLVGGAAALRARLTLPVPRLRVCQELLPKSVSVDEADRFYVHKVRGVAATVGRGAWRAL
jgi:hypothetical protein